MIGSYNNLYIYEASMYLDVLVVSQAGRNTSQSVVVEVQLPQVGNISHCAIFHRADVIVAQAKSAGKKSETRV